MKELVGTVLGGRYEIQEIVGVGGMSIVYKAYDTLEKKYVAIKVLKDEYITDPRFRKRFLNESRAIAMLSHRNIVDVYDVNFEGDVQYIVMEYIDGRTLKEYIDYSGALSVPEAIGYCKQILKALRHAHERGVIHRDVKPHNIMLLDDGTIKVTDFGIAHVSNFETVTMTDTAIGSVHYISPEQARGLATDERSDIYSTGVMLYEMVTGKLPFTGDTAVAVALQQVQQKPKPPREINPDIPVGLEQIILKAMMKDPAKRYQHAKEMLIDLKIIEDDLNMVFSYDLTDTLPSQTDKNHGHAVSSGDQKKPAGAVADQEKKKGKPARTPASSSGTSSEPGKMKSYRKKKSKKNYKWRVFRNKLIAVSSGVFLALLLVLVGYGTMQTVVNNLRQELISVPNFLGKPADEIVDDVRYTVNFKFEQVKEYNSTFGEGLVVAQSPDPGAQYPSGSVITLTVSLGKRSTTVPTVRGLPEAQAENALRRKQLLCEVIREQNDTAEEGTVLRVSPAEGSTVYEGTTVKIYVAFKTAVTQVRVPNVVGDTKEVAMTKLYQAKLDTVLREEYNSTVPEGQVISQSIEKDHVVDQGTAIIIYISLGQKPQDATEVFDYYEYDSEW